MSQLPKTIQVYQEATRLLKLHRLDNWTFEFSNEKQAVGRCFYNRHIITFSKHYLDNTPWDEIVDTLKHEIAHALAGAGHGHDSYWKSVAISVGARPQRCASSDAKLSDTAAKPNYIIYCPECKRQWPRFRLKRAMETATHCGVPVVVYRVKPD